MHDVLTWLNAPDPFSNHSQACEAKQPETGNWFLNSSDYRDWKIQSGSTLWLHGIRKSRNEPNLASG